MRFLKSVVQIPSKCLLAAFGFALALLAIAAPVAAQEERRVALVVGISDYAAAGHLKNAANDARAMAAALERLNFEVALGIDVGHTEMRNMIKDFNLAADGAAIAFVYFAGHGLQLNNRNYLVPADAELGHVKNVEFDTISVQRIVSQMEFEPRANILVLDACQNNPFTDQIRKTSSTRSVLPMQGLAEMDAPEGTLIAFAAEPGKKALDGAGADREHSPFTLALLRNIETPDIGFTQLMNRVRREVIDETNEFQKPWFQASLKGRIVLRERSEDEVRESLLENEEQAWSRIKASDDPQDFIQFLSDHPNGANSNAAMQMLSDLLAAQAGLTHEMEQAANELEVKNGRVAMLEKDLMSERSKAAERIAELNAMLSDARAKAAEEAQELTSAQQQTTARVQSLENELKSEQQNAADQDAKLQKQLENARTEAADNAQLVDTLKNEIQMLRLQLDSASSGPDAAGEGTGEQLVNLETSVRLGTTPSDPGRSDPGNRPSREQIREIQQRLTDLRCTLGTVDGVWGSKSERALDSYKTHSGSQIAGLEPSRALLAELNQRTSPVCPLSCGPRYVERDGACALKSCPSGLQLSSKGTCYKPTPKAPARNCHVFEGVQYCT